MNTRICYYCVHRQKVRYPIRKLVCMKTGKDITGQICDDWKWRWNSISEEEFKKESEQIKR